MAVVRQPAPAPRRSRAAAARFAVVITAGVLALAVTATTAFVLVGRGTVATGPVAAATPAAPTVVAAPVVVPAASVPGPALVDTNGDPVDPELAAAVTRVYAALDAADLESVRRAYSAAGSDDWHTSEPHLRSAAVRADIIAALRARPSAHDGYMYAAGGYVVQFGQGDQYARPGLLTIRGPWTYEVTTAPVYPEPTTSAPSTPEPATVASESVGDDGGCASGTVAERTEGLPCRDLETGRGVERDGTVGVHGLRPCPAGTTVPSDPDEPTRNARTGEICAMY